MAIHQQPSYAQPAPFQPYTSITQRYEGPREDVTVETPEVRELTRKKQEAADLRLAAIEADTAANIKVEQAQAEALEAEAKDRQRRDEELAKRQEAERVEMEGFRATEAAKRAEMEQKAKITDYWEDKSTPAKILSAIALGFAEGAWMGQGGPSPAMQIHNRAAENDRVIKESRARVAAEAYERATKDTAGAAAMMEQARQRISNESIARIKTIQDQLDVFIKKVPRSATAGLRAKGELLEEKAGLERKHAMEFAPKRVGPQVGKTVTTVSGVRETAGGPIDLRVTDAEGNVRIARSQEEAKDLRDSAAVVDAFAESAASLKQHLLSEGRVVPGTTASAERDALIATTRTHLLGLQKMGVLNEGERKALASELGTTILKGGKAAASGIDVMSRGVKSNFKAQVRYKSVPTQQSPLGAAPAAPREKLTAQQRALLGAVAASRSDPRAAQARAALEADAELSRKQK